MIIIIFFIIINVISYNFLIYLIGWPIIVCDL